MSLITEASRIAERQDRRRLDARIANLPDDVEADPLTVPQRARWRLTLFAGAIGLASVATLLVVLRLRGGH
jgi:hypothetical protein